MPFVFVVVQTHQRQMAIISLRREEGLGEVCGRLLLLLLLLFGGKKIDGYYNCF